MQYHAPATLKDAVKLLASSKGTTQILAGGTDLLVRMRTGFAEPDAIIDIKRISPMCKIARDGKGFSIGGCGFFSGNERKRCTGQGLARRG